VAEKMISYCGLVCTECPAFVATRENDDEKRAKTAKMWSEYFPGGLKPEDINCDGCTISSGTQFMHCAMCAVRECAVERGVENCAHCDDFLCGKLGELYKIIPDGKAVLEKIRAEIGS
jgi:hypothetical protein